MFDTEYEMLLYRDVREQIGLSVALACDGQVY